MHPQQDDLNSLRSQPDQVGDSNGTRTRHTEIPVVARRFRQWKHYASESSKRPVFFGKVSGPCCVVCEFMSEGHRCLPHYSVCIGLELVSSELTAAAAAAAITGRPVPVRPCFPRQVFMSVWSLLEKWVFPHRSRGGGGRRGRG
ncbi:RNA-directed DNA polymerase from mobile element jockey [Plakobranchus ocellatus]|uniref:RNA-directed DNA polymerase from mobile element jockey n=1 Tax=Plakobranchus ocellatus TaxID=259542 RepID=A0AAV3Z136_9GAST|nr:RNA-directed DNA polymerase from mobile element jockey [Plakobranchus ocellatus]